MTAPTNPQAGAPFVGKKGAPAPDYPLHVTIYHVTTGEAVTVKAINATEAVATGHWSATPVVLDEAAEDSSATDSTPSTATTESKGKKSKKG